MEQPGSQANFDSTKTSIVPNANNGISLIIVSPNDLLLLVELLNGVLRWAAQIPTQIEHCQKVKKPSTIRAMAKQQLAIVRDATQHLKLPLGRSQIPQIKQAG
jgi:hypothetical protein